MAHIPCDAFLLFDDDNTKNAAGSPIGREDKTFFPSPCCCRGECPVPDSLRFMRRKGSDR